MKKGISLILSLILVIMSIPSYSFAADEDESFIVWSGLNASIDKGHIISAGDSFVPEGYGEDSYTSCTAMDIVISSVEENDSFNLTFTSVYSAPDEMGVWGVFPKISSLGYTKNDIDIMANMSPDPEDEWWQMMVCIPYAQLRPILEDSSNHQITDTQHSFKIKLEEGKAQVILFFYDKGCWDNTFDTETTRTPVPIVLNFYTEEAFAQSVSLISIDVDFGQFENVNELLNGSKTTYLIVPNGKTSINATLQFVSSGMDVAVNGASPIEVPSSKELNVTLNAAPITKSGMTEDINSNNRIVVSKNGSVLCEYTIYGVCQRFDDLPDAVVDYLPIGSQYTNGEGARDWGLRAVRSLVGSNYSAGGTACGPVSLGNFGGYIIYEYNDYVTDDPKNPYGIDFIVFGNAYNGNQEFGEPGQVWVSEDGNTWYALAGSMHYEDYTDWNHSVTYSKEGNFTKITDNSSGASEIYNKAQYPEFSNYPFHTFSSADETSITVEGVYLKADGSTDASGSTMARYPKFGYADVGSLGTKLKGEDETNWNEGTTDEGFVALARNIAKNPYITDYSDYSNGENGEYNHYNMPTDGMDLAWAVDPDGQPVAFENGVRFIKIATASLINNIGIGEKSTEVNMVRVAQANSSAVGISDEPDSISFGGTEVDFTSGAAISNNVFRIDDIAVDKDGFDVVVNAEGSNVYINNNCASSVTYDQIPDHKIVRVIVQNDECEPRIYVFNLREMTEDEKAAKK